MSKFLIMISGFIKYKDLLYELVIRDIKIRYRRSVLGLLWTLLNPILMMTVLTIVFSQLFKFEIENFPIYFFAGNIVFTFMTEATTNSLYSIVGNASLIKKVYVPKYLFPVSKVLSSLVNLFFAYIAMMAVMAVTGVSYGSAMLLTPLLIVYLVMFTTGLGLILATVMVFFRDTAHLYSVVTLAWMYLTPIFYPGSLLGEKMGWILTVNPMYHYITYLRTLVLQNQVPGIEANITCFLIGFVFFIVGLYTFYKKQDKFILYV
ncbi:ABC-2 type transport system permease protein [Desulfitobacterium sp. LBE]|uniref:ABC transporter permease n=1 Tax=Desulfitobacterium sp. LBE TaxID=884086 RepID=UPI00119B6236|nr:ABC transporter permease [Desulfitobacterium sp. LBE]TWH59720.1 ABC-2 type transport system permease protein [Desulfitobacterium sp. LBE]